MMMLSRKISRGSNPLDKIDGMGQISFCCGKSGAMPTLVVGMRETRENTPHAMASMGHGAPKSSFHNKN
jgi:hypothetical protein